MGAARRLDGEASKGRVVGKKYEEVVFVIMYLVDFQREIKFLSHSFLFTTIRTRISTFRSIPFHSILFIVTKILLPLRRWAVSQGGMRGNGPECLRAEENGSEWALPIPNHSKRFPAGFHWVVRPVRI